MKPETQTERIRDLCADHVKAIEEEAQAKLLQSAKVYKLELLVGDNYGKLVLLKGDSPEIHKWEAEQLARTARVVDEGAISASQRGVYGRLARECVDLPRVHHVKEQLVRLALAYHDSMAGSRLNLLRHVSLGFAQCSVHSARKTSVWRRLYPFARLRALVSRRHIVARCVSS